MKIKWYTIAAVAGAGLGAYLLFRKKDVITKACALDPRYRKIIGYDNEPDQCLDRCTKKYVDMSVCNLE